MRLLQLHEYLAILDGGATTEPVEGTLFKSSLNQAESIWPQLRDQLLDGSAQGCRVCGAAQHERNVACPYYC